MKRFTKNDENFVCLACGKNVPALGYSSRNHCPFCLHSIHVDVEPGDRANPCGALMTPIGLDPTGRKGPVIVHQCTRCGLRKRNRTADDDDQKLLIALSARPLTDKK